MYFANLRSAVSSPPIRIARRPQLRRRVVATSAASLMLGSLVACSSHSSSGSNGSVTLAKTSDAVQLLLLDVADKKGFYTKHHLKVKTTILNGSSTTVSALTSSSVDFAAVTATPLLVGDTKGGKLGIISGLSSYPAQVVMSKKRAEELHITPQTPIAQRVKALKGKQVGILDVGGGLQYTIETVLQAYGLGAKDAPVVGVTPYSSMLTALKRNAIAEAVPSVPYGDAAVQQGGVMIANVWAGEVPAIKPAPFEVVGVNKSWAAKHTKEVSEMRAALQDAMDWLHANPAQAATLAHQLLPAFSAKLLAQSIGDGSGFSKTTDFTQGDFTSLQKFSKISGDDVDSLAYDSVVIGKTAQ